MELLCTWTLLVTQIHTVNKTAHTRAHTDAGTLVKSAKVSGVCARQCPRCLQGTSDVCKGSVSLSYFSQLYVNL